MMEQEKQDEGGISRREFVRAGAATIAGVAGAMVLGSAMRAGAQPASAPDIRDHDHGHAGAVGTVDHGRNGFDPSKVLEDFDYGRASTLPNGQTLREYEFVATDQEIEVAPGIFFPAWVYNGRVPGPTIRCTEGDRIRIEFINGGSHPHTIHFHGIHTAGMDGVPGVGAGTIVPGERTVYEFDALPMGCHLYHCHSLPLKRHIHKGLYGAFIVDPDPTRYSGDEERVARSRNRDYSESRAVREMVMVMNGFDTNFDGDNEIYAANSIAFAYSVGAQPIKVVKSQLQRLYLINATEFDPINSFHLHANFFDYYDHGTTLSPTLKTVDTIMQCQGQRGILEFSFASPSFQPGLYMFHAHQSEFAELGWMGFFEVVAG